VLYVRPQAFFDTLTADPHNYKLSGVGEPQFHLGGNLERDAGGTLTWGSKKYIEKLLGNHERTFGELPTERSYPMENRDSPEIDQSPRMEVDGVSHYQSLIGVLQ
jgi:hypothetical protein